jgi:HK97 family phage prohead protease
MSEATEFRGGREPDPLVRREYAADLTPGDGRTVDCRIVPYGERIEHNDGHGGVPVGMPYTEEWAAGAFTHQLKAANRVLANVEHQEGLAGIVGHGVALIERSDGLYGSFKLHDNADGDKALMLVKEGVLDSVSLEARPQKTVRTRDGVVRRVKAHLEAVAFARFGAYPSATVLAVRHPATFEEEEIPEELLPVEMDAATVERCRRLGLELPSRYEEAHPEPGTPEDSGTPAPAPATVNSASKTNATVTWKGNT